MRKIIKSLLSFYDSFNKKAVVSSMVTKSDYVPGVHKFVYNFINHYTNNKYFMEILMVSLVTGYLSKVKGVVNPPYGEKLLDFFLDLATSGDEKVF